MRLTLWVYYKRIYIEGLDHLPKDGPIILASNHPNSFLDACVLGAILPRRLHFIARGDVFNSGWKQWILGKLQIIPIYRLQEGAENLDKNKETFKRSHEVLDASGCINIYSEGICIQEKRLRKLKKGTARIALDYVTERKKPLNVVAVGLNYLQPMKFRKELIMGINSPFDASKVTPSFSESPALSIIAFNQELTTKMREVVIHIEDKSHEKKVDQLILEHRDQLPRPSGFIQVNTGILKTLVGYTNQLNTTEVLPEPKALPHKETSGIVRLLLQLFALPGILLNGLPILGAARITKNKVKLNEFKDSVLVAGSMLFHLIYSIVLLIVLSGIFGILKALGILTLIFVAGAISVWCYDAWTKAR